MSEHKTTWNCRRSLAFLVALFAAWMSFPASSEVVLTKGLKYPLALWPQSTFFVDPDGKMSFEEVQRQKFKSPEEVISYPTFGYTSNTIWIRFSLNNQSDINQFVLALDHIYLNKVTLYVPDSSGRHSEVKFGLDVPFGEEEVEYYGYAVDLKIRHWMSGDFYLKADSRFPISLPVMLYDKETFQDRLRLLDRLFWFYIGVISILIGYNLFVYLSVGDSAYLYYVCTLISLHLFSNLAQYGVVRTFVFPNFTFFQSNVFYFNYVLATLFMLLFANRYLEVSKKHPRFARVLITQVGFNCVLLFVGLFGHLYQVDQIYQINATVFALLLLGYATVLAFAGNRQALFFSVAWACLILFWVLTFLRIDGVVERNFFTMYSVLLGAIIEGTLLSLALADRLNQFRQEKELAQTIAIQTSAKAEVAKRVAHDIRSPLSALEVATQDLSDLPEGTRLLIRNAARRIKDIANDLVSNDNPSKSAEEGFSKSCLLPSLFELILSEKRLQYRSKSKILLESRLSGESYGVFAVIDSIEFKRVISNLIDNAVEAIGDEGTVYGQIQNRNGMAVLSISDTGRGISPEILSKLGTTELSVGKSGRGMGMGVYHSRKTLEKWGGRLEFTSRPGEETTVTVLLPQGESPAWFLGGLSPEIRQSPGTVIVDDDSAIYHLWRERFRKEGITQRLEHFVSPSDLRNWMADNRGKGWIYLIDYEFVKELENGLDLILELQIVDTSVLVTSRFEEISIQERCKQYGIKLLPKTLAYLVPLS
jgi:signal transduction histidine kinase